MSFAGNDNYRPGLNMPDPIKRGSGWLSGNLAQLMVFLNGLILTITAFAVLSVFIDEIVKEGLIKSTEEAHQHVAAQYKATEKSLGALSTVIDMTGDVSTELVKNYTRRQSADLNVFEQILWVYSAEGEWNVEPLLAKPNYQDWSDSKETLIDFINRNMGGLDADTAFVSDLSVLPQSRRVLSSDNETQPYGIIKRQRNESAFARGYLLGIADFSNKISEAWYEKNNHLIDIQVLDVDTDRTVFAYRKAGSTNGSKRFLNIFSSDFAGKKIDTRVELKISARESFLQKIPLLMLLFGVTLTLIGTLYVRNNQNQSRKLAEMNKELAHKNFELSQEVNERERLNKVIQKSAREHRSIINAVRDIIFETDTDGKIVFLNETWVMVTGFELERSIGRNLIDLLYVQDQAEQKDNFKQLVSGKKKSYRTFTRLRSSDGTYRSVELAISMLRHDENKELRIVGTITDVEERRRAERALSEAERKYRAIVENAAGGIYQVTADGQFLSANPAFSKIIGFDSPEEVLRDVVHAHEALYVDISDRERFLQEIKSSKSSKIFEGEVKKKDGDVIWVRESVRPVLDDDGGLLFYEGSMEDVDQRKKAEIALQEAKVESDLANRAKSEFLTNMSHELRTPLNSIIGFSEIIQNEAFGKLPSKEYKEYATDIFDSGQNLLKVINEILDVSRIETGQRTLQESMVNIKDLFTSCLDLMDEKIKTGQIRVENKAIDETFNIIGEKHAIKQMLLNIMSNAVKFSPENSLIMLDAELDSKNRMRVSITDTGIGLTDDELEKAISPFGQIETEHSRTKSGTGLGLTLVKSLIELHGGELEIVSQKAIGTTVTLIFPEKRVAQRQATPQAGESDQASQTQGVSKETIT